MSEWINKQELLEQIGMDSEGSPGMYGDEWKFIDTINNMPVRSDLISRCELFNRLATIPAPAEANDFKAKIYEVIQEMEITDRPQGWITCSERLPNEDEQDPELGVIVTLGNGYSGLQYDWYHDGHWYDWDGFVVAWMSLPKPWKGADDE